jgi:hypothetical protein
MRLLSAGSLIFFATLWVYHLATGGGWVSPGGVALGLLLLLSAAASLLNLGDRYGIDEEGIFYSNPLLGRLGLKLDRRVAWEDVISVRTHRGLRHGHRESSPTALFLEISSQRRFVIDSVEDLHEVMRLIDVHRRTRPAGPSVTPDPPGAAGAEAMPAPPMERHP